MKSGTTLGGFERLAQDPFFWLKQARELDSAAMLIWEAIRSDFVKMSESEVGKKIDLKEVPYANLGGVFWLNAGFAIENLLKGVIVQAHPHFIVNGTITRPLKTHNLLELAKHASIDLGASDAFFLEVGTQCVQWAGRYPCSLKRGESKPPVFSEADVIAYRNLFDRIVGRFDASHTRDVTLMRLA